MDKLVELIVRLMVALAGKASVLPGLRYARYSPGEKVKVLLVGYNGARNTGSDVRVAALADQIIEALGEGNVEVSVMTIDAPSTAVYFEGKARQIGFTTMFFQPLLKACSEHHVAVLSEGSTFKSKFADALTMYTCEAAGIMRAQGKPCIAYGGEVGAMSPPLERVVRDLCTDVLFVARSSASHEAARELGLEARHGTDTAWTFDSSRGRIRAVELLRAGGWDGERPLLGIAPINPFWWPVRPSLVKWIARAFGSRSALQFQKWYFFSWNEQRKRLYGRYLDDLAAAVVAFAREHGCMPVVLGMEKLDEDACRETAARLGGGVPVILSKEHDGYTIGEVLRGLDLLVTSRYHAQVLATGADVPSVAVSMDERLDNLAAELGLPGELLAHVDDRDLAVRVLGGLEYAWENRDGISGTLSAGRRALTALLGEMEGWFREHLARYGIAAGAPS